MKLPKCIMIIAISNTQKTRMNRIRLTLKIKKTKVTRINLRRDRRLSEVESMSNI
jgi:hypothetical protein